MKKIIICLCGLAFFLIPFVAKAQIPAQVKIYGADGGNKSSFNVLYPQYQGGVDLALANLGQGGKRIVVARGGDTPTVEVYKPSGELDYMISAFDIKFASGISVAAGDVDGDGVDEIIVGAGYRGGPQVRVFKGTENISNFFAYDQNARSGVKVTAGDINNDGKAEVITGPNLNSDPVINIFDYKGNKLKSQKIDLNKTGGVSSMSVGDVNGDGKNELIIGSGYGNKSAVMVFNSDLAQLTKVFPFGENYQGGVNVAVGNFDSDPADEIVVAPSFHGYYLVKVINMDGTRVNEFTDYDKYFAGVALAAGDVDNSGQNEIITVPQRIYSSSKSEAYKFIEVDLTKQSLTYWQDGRKLDTFLISSGIARSPTPKGEFKIYNKRPDVRMTWYYGPGNPLNYDLPHVPWVASFKGPYTIHGTYWHHNFGHPMSHGCVNMYTPQAKLIYDWVDIGTPIIIF